MLNPDHIWVAGQDGDDEVGRWSVWRMSFAGELDECFDGDGQLVLDGEYEGGNATGLAALDDGTIAVHGVDAEAALRVVGIHP